MTIQPNRRPISQSNAPLSSTAESTNISNASESDDEEYFYNENTKKRQRDIEGFLDVELDYLTIKCLDYHISVELWEDDLKNFKQQFMQKQDHLIAEAKTVNHQYSEFFKGICKVDRKIEEARVPQEIEGVTPDPLLGTRIYHKADNASSSLKHYSNQLQKRIETVGQEIISLKNMFDQKKKTLEAEAMEMKQYNQRFVKLVGKLNKEKLKVSRRA